ncbi:hypothetical protein Tco_0564373 [Tanacetum coccineum]
MSSDKAVFVPFLILGVGIVLARFLEESCRLYIIAFICLGILNSRTKRHLREKYYTIDKGKEQNSGKKKYAGKSYTFRMRAHHDGVFRMCPGRIYDGGKATIVNLVDSNEVFVEEMEDTLEVSEMSPISIRKVLKETNEDLMKSCSASIPSWCRELILGYRYNEVIVEPFTELTQLSMEVNTVRKSSHLPSIELMFSTLDMSFNSQPVEVIFGEGNTFVEPGVEVTLFQVRESKQLWNLESSSQILADLILETDLDVIDTNEFESDCGYESDVDYARRKMVRESRKQVITGEDGTVNARFKAFHRGLLELDGDFMRGPYPGHLLTAMGIDSDDEKRYSLKIGIELILPYLLKGVILALKLVFPSAEHKLYLRHIHENMKLQWNGRAFKDHLWICVTTTTVQHFERVMLDFKSFSEHAHAWLSKTTNPLDEESSI